MLISAVADRNGDLSGINVTRLPGGRKLPYPISDEVFAGNALYWVDSRNPAVVMKADISKDTVSEIRLGDGIVLAGDDIAVSTNGSRYRKRCRDICI